MGRSRVMNLDAQVANNATAAMEKAYKAEMAECTEILRLHPQARAPCLKFLKGAGFTMDTKPLQLNKSVEQLGKEKSITSRKAAAEAASSKGEGKTLIPSKYNSLAAMSYTVLAERILPGLDPVSLSPANVHAALLAYPNAASKQLETLRILEFVSGKPANMPIRGALWEWEQLLLHLKSSTDVRGRLDRPLRLPVDWPQHGVYSIKEVTAEDEIIVEHRFTGQVVKVGLAEFEPLPPPGSSFVLEQNFSELSAEITIEGGSAQQAVCVGSLFHSHSTKKRRAITDGSPEDTRSSPSTSSKMARCSSKSSIEDEPDNK